MKAVGKSLAKFVALPVIVAVVVLLYVRLFRVNPTTVGFTFLLAVLVISAVWGLRYAIVLAVLSTLAYNFFFLPPRYTFTIADPQNWIALLTFLVTAVIGSQLAERARREALTANQRRTELEHLYAFSQRMLATDNVLTLVNNIPGAVVESFRRRVRGHVSRRTQEGLLLRHQGAGRDHRRRAEKHVAGRSEPSVNAAQSVVAVPLRVGVRSVGALGIQGGDIGRQTLDAIVSLISDQPSSARARSRSLARTQASRESERLRSILLDSVTHDFRTPLTAIKASAESLLENPGMDDSSRGELLTIINEESDRLNRLVGEAAEMAQPDAGAIELHVEPHSIREAIDEAMAVTKNAWSKHPVEVKAEESLPPVRMDVRRISEVLAQLIDNAAKYSPPGTPITISAEVIKPMLVTSVADQGLGIEGIDQGMIFEKFYRGRGQRSSIQGTGMGLAIAKALVEAHGGNHLQLSASWSVGSVFSIPATAGVNGKGRTTTETRRHRGTAASPAQPQLPGTERSSSRAQRSGAETRSLLSGAKPITCAMSSEFRGAVMPLTSSWLCGGEKLRVPSASLRCVIS